MPSEGLLITKSCLHCGASFARTSRRGGRKAKYCSGVCARTATGLGERRGAANNRWKGGKPVWVCLYCGGKFRAYHNDHGQERKFCSWECCDKHHRKEPVGMRERVRYENELVEFLGERDYRCLRSAGSRGPVDVFAFSRTAARLIQVKSTVNLRRQGNTTVFKRAIKELLALPAPPSCTRELWVRVLRRGWFYLVLEDVPEDDRALTRFIQTAEWVTPL
jgi:Holliday junction resolvase